MVVVGLFLTFLLLSHQTCSVENYKIERSFSFLFISSSAGGTPVVMCGVVLYLSRKRDNLSCMVPSSIFSTPSLKALTARSAWPFEAGWYGETLVCLTPFFERKFSNSALVKWDHCH